MLEVPEDQRFRFVIASLPSVWALETMLLLKSIAPEGRTTDEIVSTLRSSKPAVAQALRRLEHAGLVSRAEEIYRFSPAAPVLASFADEVEKLYASKPLSLITAIVRANTENLNIFADSFRISE